MNKTLCLFFDQGFSTCFLNGSACDCPFSKKGCEIQCERIFKEKPEGEKANRYKPDTASEDNTPLTRADIFKRVGIKKGMAVADYFIPYSELEAVAAGPSELIDYGVEMVKKKFNDAGQRMKHLRIYHNAKILDQLGVYIVGVV